MKLKKMKKKKINQKYYVINKFELFMHKINFFFREEMAKEEDSIKN